MNIKVLLVAIAVCLLLISGIEGYKKRHANLLEKRIVQEVGDELEDGLEELASEVEAGFRKLFNFFRRR